MVCACVFYALGLHADIRHLDFQVFGILRHLQVVVTVHVGHRSLHVAVLAVHQHHVGSHDRLLGTSEEFGDGTGDGLCRGNCCVTNDNKQRYQQSLYVLIHHILHSSLFILHSSLFILHSSLSTYQYSIDKLHTAIAEGEGQCKIFSTDIYFCGILDSHADSSAIVRYLDIVATCSQIGSLERRAWIRIAGNGVCQ